MKYGNNNIDLYTFNPQHHSIDEILAFLRELDFNQLDDKHRVDVISSRTQASL